MTERMYTIGTKVCINNPKLDDGVFHGKIGKIIERNRPGSGKLPYTVKLKFYLHTEEVPFYANELVRINKKRKNT